MKVGLIVPGFSADERDWCIPALLDYVRVLARHAEVHVFALRYPHRRGRYPVYGAAVHAFGGAQARAVRTARLWMTVQAAIVAEHKTRPFDLLHAFWADETGLLAVLAGRRLAIPAIVSLGGGELARLPEIGYGGQLRRVERWKIALSLRWAAIVTAGSEFLAERARAQLPVGARSKVRWAPLGVDLELFPPRLARRRDGTRPLRLVNIASLLPVKNHVLLLDALARARASGLDATLTLIGDGPLAGVLRDRSTQHVPSAVTFRGAVRREGLADALHGADVFVLASRHEAECLAALEAAACGLPLIGTAVGVIPELVPDVALAVPSGDEIALAAAMRRLSDPAVRLEMGRAARWRVEADYALHVCVDRFEALYTRALTGVMKG